VSVETYITRYVYLHKEIALEGLGIIKLDDVVPDNEFIHKQKTVPVSNLHFEHKPSVKTTPEFIAFYSQKKGKIHSLAENDIESYLSMALQFLNIGNPVEFKGLGTLQKQRGSNLTITPGYFIEVKDDAGVKTFKERQTFAEEKSDTNFFGEKKIQRSNLSRMAIGIIVALVALVGAWWLYNSFLKSPQTEAPVTSDTLVAQQVVVPDTTALTTTRTDSATNNTTVTAALTDSLTTRKWKAIFRIIRDKETALSVWESSYKRYASKIMMETSDSAVFRFYVELQSPLNELERKKDSIARFFARSVIIEPMQ
jgi:hypothetical protein